MYQIKAVSSNLISYFITEFDSSLFNITAKVVVKMSVFFLTHCNKLYFWSLFYNTYIHPSPYFNQYNTSFLFAT